MFDDDGAIHGGDGAGDGFRDVVEALGIVHDRPDLQRDPARRNQASGAFIDEDVFDPGVELHVGGKSGPARPDDACFPNGLENIHAG